MKRRDGREGEKRDLEKPILELQKRHESVGGRLRVDVTLIVHTSNSCIRTKVSHLFSLNPTGPPRKPTPHPHPVNPQTLL